ncbi:UvrD-helicase domain-containing protein, partial [Enterococcus sp.]|uniref:UvrD-helicase domain-containing protein n=1 Tax=Enterococcus sp. TaxID=35783 RepID=UPI002FC6B1B8
MSYISELNKEQKEAVEHIHGPCLVVAGAGSGKTKVLTTRIAYLIDELVDSSNILAITFTNKAAKEMKERLYKITGYIHAFVGTFHSFGLKIIKENYELCGLVKNFTIIDSDDVLTIIKKILKEFDLDPKEYSPSYIRSKISFIKNEMLNESEINYFLTSTQEKVAIRVYNE